MSLFYLWVTYNKNPQNRIRELLLDSSLSTRSVYSNNIYLVNSYLVKIQYSLTKCPKIVAQLRQERLESPLPLPSIS